MKSAFLELRSWSGISFGAEHYYGKVKWPRRGSVKDDEHEVQRPLSAKEAADLNRKDEGSRLSKYKAGDETYRFDAEADVIAAAVKWFAEKHPGDVLFQCDVGNRSATPMICYPPNLKQFAEKANALAKEWRDIGGYEGDEARASAIDREWYALVKHIIES